jgi:RHS repeat-associated protein
MMDAVGNTFRLPSREDRRYGPGGQLLEAEGARYVYDADGNLLEKHEPGGGVWRYTWSGSGLLHEVERPDRLRVRFAYDALARRTAKSVFRPQADGTPALEREVHFVWDGQVLLHELSDAEGLTTWLFEPDSFTPLVKEDRSGRYAVVTDLLGTPTEMYDELGRLAWQMQMDLFGARHVDVAQTSAPWAWPGQYVDEETGLFYNRARYYSPELGRYVSQDPLRLSGGLSLYGYVDDPTRQMDPLGLMKCGGAAGGSKGNYDKALGQGLYVLIQKVNGQSIVKYIGRGDAPARGIVHAADAIKGKYTQVILRENNLTKAEAKNLEQRLIDHYGLNNLDNVINSYVDANPNSTLYRNAVSDADFNELLQDMNAKFGIKL